MLLKYAIIIMVKLTEGGVEYGQESIPKEGENIKIQSYKHNDEDSFQLVSKQPM